MLKNYIINLKWKHVEKSLIPYIQKSIMKSIELHKKRIILKYI